MTKIKLFCQGAAARVRVEGAVTAGAAGIPVEICCDDAWQGLTRSIVFMTPLARMAAAGVGSSAVVPPEVLTAGLHLYIALEGRDPSGAVVLPTGWADCGVIRGSSVHAGPIPGGNDEEASGFYIPVLDGAGNLRFNPSNPGLPQVSGGCIRGPQGIRGESGVALGGAEPTDPAVKVWIRPESTGLKRVDPVDAREDMTLAVGVDSSGRLLAAKDPDVQALQAEAERTDRSVRYLWKLSQGIVYGAETVTGSGSTVPIPSGALEYAEMQMVGGMSQRNTDGTGMLDAKVDSITSRRADAAVIAEHPIPQAVQELPDYGIGINGSCYNRIEQTDTGWQYVQMVKSVDLGTLGYRQASTTKTGSFRMIADNAAPGAKRAADAYNPGSLLCGPYATGSVDNTWNAKDKTIAISNSSDNIALYDENYAAEGAGTIAAFKAAMAGKLAYYELAQPVVTDITHLMTGFDGIVQVEAGGSLTMHYPALDEGYELAVPSRTEIMVKVAEVTA